MPRDPFAAPTSVAVAGTGRLTLDVIIRAGQSPRCQAGGTCGNVLANLACLGWRSYPLTDLGDDDPGRRFRADLARWGTCLDLIRDVHGDETPVIIHHIRDGDSGPVHSFSSRCPFCHQRLRNYEPVPLDAVQERLARVPAVTAFFFDRDSEGALLLAQRCRDQGAVIVFEPNYAGKETQFDEALAVAHVLKFSRDRLPRLTDRPLDGPDLLIETQGSEGLRYLDRRAGEAAWQHLPIFPILHVRDAGGAGDWTTAGFLHLAAQEGYTGFRALSADALRDALRFGQALGAWNCAFEGARGGLYHLQCERWQSDVRRILAGEVFDPLEGASAGTQDEAGRFCPHCGGS